MEILITGEGPTPQYATIGSAGADLCAFINEPIILNPQDIKLFPTGFNLKIPEGYTGQVCSRSGLSLKGIIVTNAPGIIDCDYRGQVGVILTNISSKPYTVNPNDKIAQLLFIKVERAAFVRVTSLDETARGQGGFGSTGL